MSIIFTLPRYCLRMYVCILAEDRTVCVNVIDRVDPTPSNPHLLQERNLVRGRQPRRWAEKLHRSSPSNSLEQKDTHTQPRAQRGANSSGSSRFAKEQSEDGELPNVCFSSLLTRQNESEKIRFSSAWSPDNAVQSHLPEILDLIPPAS